MTTRICEYCAKEFETLAYRANLKYGRGRFCSRACANRWNVAHGLTGQPRLPDYGPDRKRCPQCKTIKDRIDFSPRNFLTPGDPCRECAYARTSKWASANRERINATIRKNRARHPEKSRAACRKWREANRDKSRASSLAYAKAHPDKNCEAQRRRILRLRAVRGSHTIEEWRLLCAKFDQRCVCCGETGQLTRDHIIPIIKLGSDSIDNIQPMCRFCNSTKKAESIDYRDAPFTRTGKRLG